MAEKYLWKIIFIQDIHLLEKWYPDKNFFGIGTKAVDFHEKLG